MQSEPDFTGFGTSIRRDIDELMSAIRHRRVLKIFWELKVLFWGLVIVGIMIALEYARFSLFP